MTDKINDYKSKGLNESEYRDYRDPLLSSKSHDLIKKVVDQLIGETQLIFPPIAQMLNPLVEKRWRGGLVRAPYTTFSRTHDNKKRENLASMSEFINGSPKLLDKIEKYIKETYGLTDREGDVALINYNSRIRNKIKEGGPGNNSELNESKDNINTFTDDKDFPFLNKLANHAMRETEISRNAVRFPFIDGYISNNNFHRYFDGTSYAQLPFEATIEADQYLKQFGLTENEKEIWWDIYVVKVRDAVDERDLKIIDNYGELNESIEDNHLDKIANSVVRESEIFEKDGKLYLSSPTFPDNVNVETVLDILTTPGKRPIPLAFTQHMKNIYNIEKKGYNTVIQTVWRLYRDKMIKKIEDTKERLSISKKQQKFFDHILKTLVGETQVQTMKDWLPDDETYEQKVWVTPPFLNHGIDIPGYRDDSVEWNEFSYFGYGYQRYMKDIYGLTDKETLKLWAVYYKALKKKIEELREQEKENID